MDSDTIRSVEPPPGLPFWTRVSNALVPLRNWWAGAFGRRRAFIEGRVAAIDNAAMKAYDMGRPDIREAINRLVERGK